MKKIIVLLLVLLLTILTSCSQTNFTKAPYTSPEETGYYDITSSSISFIYELEKSLYTYGDTFTLRFYVSQYFFTQEGYPTENQFYSFGRISQDYGGGSVFSKIEFRLKAQHTDLKIDPIIYTKYEDITKYHSYIIVVNENGDITSHIQKLNYFDFYIDTSVLTNIGNYTFSMDIRLTPSIKYLALHPGNNLEIMNCTNDGNNLFLFDSPNEFTVVRFGKKILLGDNIQKYYHR